MNRPLFDRATISGLCATCIHNHNCSLSAGERLSKYYCEEFESTEKEVKPDTNPASKEESKSAACFALQDLYLCSNCGGTTMCILTGSENGVVTCNEFVAS